MVFQSLTIASFSMMQLCMKQVLGVLFVIFCTHWTRTGWVTAIKWSVEKIVGNILHCLSTDQLNSLQKVIELIFSETSVEILGGHQRLVKVRPCYA